MRISGVMLVATMAAGSVMAAELKTADEIIEFSSKKQAGYKTVSADYRQTMQMMGSPMQFSGHLWQQQPRQMRMEMDMPMMGQQAKMLMVLGTDGIMWQEMGLPGGKQIMKMDLNQMKGANPLDQADPSQAWKKQKEWMDFTLVGTEELDGQPVYVLEGKWKEAATKTPQGAAMAAMFSKSRLYLGQRDGYMHKMAQYDKAGSTVVMTMEFANVKFDEELPAKLFTYQPPEGAPVMDMTKMGAAMVGGQSSAPPPPPVK
jgi:outer membrane lipoprotein-sorting protein